MKKNIFLISVLTGALMVSCGSNKGGLGGFVQSHVINPVANVVDKVTHHDNIVTSAVTDSKGNKMNLAFNNDKGTAVVVLNGETINMVRDVTASGVRMHNADYTYEESQGHIVMRKHNQVVFDNQDMVTATVTNKQGKKMNLTYNNNNNTLVINLDGEEIHLKGEKMASGLKYTNATYVYEEWQGHSTLSKAGKVVFDNEK